MRHTGAAGTFAPPRLTKKVQLEGSQDRLRQMILYVAIKCETARRFGLIKLNKILWKADFDAFAARGRPVTGREYQRLRLGPAPKEMKPLLRDMARDGDVRFDLRRFPSGKIERRTVALVEPNLSYFDQSDLAYVRKAIQYYWDMNGEETSDDSHGIAWKTRKDNDPMFYELSYLSDEKVTSEQRAEIVRRFKARQQRQHA